MLELYRERGHLFARVEASATLSSDSTRAAITLSIAEHEPVIVGELRIEGARATDIEMLRALVAIHPGEVYRPAAARRAEERLRELGVFSGVSIAPEDPELEERVKAVVVNVTERPPQLLDFALGASSAQGIRGAFEYGYGNLFGRAIRFSVRVQLAGQFFYLDDVLRERYEALSLGDRLERRVTTGLLIPYTGIANLRTSINLLHQRENERTFGLDKNAVNLTFTLRPSRKLQTSLSSGFELNDIELLVDDAYDEILAGTTDPRLRQLLLVPEGRSALIAVESTTSIDLRDSPFDPTRGFFASVTAEWARSISSENVEVAGEERAFFSHHVRTVLNASGYAPLGRGLVLALQARYGRVIHLNDRSETYPNRQFFLGGVDTMRAYRQHAMIPEDLAGEISRG
ncbi:MAG: BamA/TamA family outer membrane protein, partial [Polyangiaceae bacterium]|nr:BamA/TamA family outer membrane protein [Polyangiaceae bacterium]